MIRLGHGDDAAWKAHKGSVAADVGRAKGRGRNVATVHSSERAAHSSLASGFSPEVWQKGVSGVHWRGATHPSRPLALHLVSHSWHALS